MKREFKWFTDALARTGVKVKGDVIWCSATNPRTKKPYTYAVFRGTLSKKAMRHILATCNKHNRQVKTARVGRYLRILKSGRWFENGMPVHFDQFGDLLDGAHRLTMFVNAGVDGATMLFTFGVPTEAFITYDAGSRSGADVFYTLQAACPAAREAAVNFTLRYARNTLHGQHSDNPDHELRRRVNDEIGPLLDRAVAFAHGFASSRSPKNVTRGILAALYIILTIAHAKTLRRASVIALSDDERIAAWFLSLAFDPSSKVGADLPTTGLVVKFREKLGGLLRAVESHYRAPASVVWTVQVWNRMMTKCSRSWTLPKIPKIASAFRLPPVEMVAPASKRQRNAALAWWGSQATAASRSDGDEGEVDVVMYSTLLLGLSARTTPIFYERGARYMVNWRTKAEEENAQVAIKLSAPTPVVCNLPIKAMALPETKATKAKSA